MLYATVHPIDKHPDIVASQGTMDLIEACNPSSISLVLEYVRGLERKEIALHAELAEWKLRAEHAEERYESANRMRNGVLAELANLQGGKTGWPPGMLQDDDRKLSKALANKVDSRMHTREAAAAIEGKEKTE